MGPVEVLWDGDGISPRCEQTDTCENSTFPILGMQRVIILNGNEMLIFKTLIS